jgi:hypothetical protein
MTFLRQKNINYNDFTGHNLRLLQAADMFFGQFRSLDMIAVDLVSELQIVRAPDKSSFDSPPVKAARR